jgi:hypothetical protein
VHGQGHQHAGAHARGDGSRVLCMRARGRARVHSEGVFARR